MLIKQKHVHVTTEGFTTNQVWVAGGSQCVKGGSRGGVVQFRFHGVDEQGFGYDQVKSVGKGGQNIKVRSVKWMVMMVRVFPDS